jgi:hypothetical protein
MRIRRKVKTDLSVVYVVEPNNSVGWRVIKKGARKPSNIFARKGAAVQRAKDLAQARAPAQLRVIKRDGTVQSEYEFTK